MQIATVKQFVTQFLGTHWEDWFAGDANRATNHQRHDTNCGAACKLFRGPSTVDHVSHRLWAINCRSVVHPTQMDTPNFESRPAVTQVSPLLRCSLTEANACFKRTKEMCTAAGVSEDSCMDSVHVVASFLLITCIEMRPLESRALPPSDRPKPSYSIAPALVAVQHRSMEHTEPLQTAAKSDVAHLTCWQRRPWSGCRFRRRCTRCEGTIPRAAAARGGAGVGAAAAQCETAKAGASAAAAAAAPAHAGDLTRSSRLESQKQNKD